MLEMGILEKCANQLADKKNQQLYRTHRPCEARNSSNIHIDGKDYVNFSSNDYLGLSQHPSVKQSLAKAVSQHGFGSGSSVVISGYSRSQQLLEEKFAAFVNRDQAVLFNSGYHANLSVVKALTQRNAVVLADKLIHASMLDAATLARVKLKRYKHQDMAHLSQLACHSGAELIVSESVFSMDGDITPVDQICTIADESQAIACIDDAHGLGVLSPNGVTGYHHLDQQQLPVLISPLGKAMGGLGAFVSGPEDIIEWIRQSARPYHYTTALPIAVCAGLSKAIDVLQSESDRFASLNSNITFFIKQAKARGLPLVSEDLTPIKPILIGDNAKALFVEQQLHQHGIYLTCIRPPTVPDGTARLRVSLSCEHSKAQIRYLLDVLQHLLS